MGNTLISTPTGVFIGIFAWMGIVTYSCEKIKFLRKVPSIVVLFVGAMLLAYFRIMPTNSEVYGLLFLPMVFLALGGYLVGTDVRDIIKVGPAAIIIYIIGSIGLFLGAIVSAKLPFIVNALGTEHAAMNSGMLAAFWNGATSNFASIAAAIDAPAEVQTPVLVIGSLLVFVVLAISLLLAGNPTSKINSFLKPRHHVDDYFPQINIDKPVMAEKPSDFITALGLISSIVLVSWLIGIRLAGIFPGLGAVLLTVVVLSILGLIVGRYANPMVKVPGTNMIGPFGIYAFLALMGFQSGSINVIFQEPLIFLQAFITMVIYLIIVFIGAKLTRIPFELVNICVNAQVGGYPDAIAVATSYKKAFVPVAIILSILGVVFGTYIGLATYLILK